MTVRISDLIHHSGGAIGADEQWETISWEFGFLPVKSKHYWHGKKNPYSGDEDQISEEDFKEGVEMVNKANLKLHRKPEKYMNLLARNWPQVKYSEEIFAISTLKNEREVNGGTGWAVQMAIDKLKPVYVFDQLKELWFEYNYEHELGEEKFEIIAPEKVYIKFFHFAGIGTREINEAGKNAIRQVYENTLEFFQRINIPLKDKKELKVYRRGEFIEDFKKWYVGENTNYGGIDAVSKFILNKGGINGMIAGDDTINISAEALKSILFPNTSASISVSF